METEVKTLGDILRDAQKRATGSIKRGVAKRKPPFRIQASQMSGYFMALNLQRPLALFNEAASKAEDDPHFNLIFQAYLSFEPNTVLTDVFGDIVSTDSDFYDSGTTGCIEEARVHIRHRGEPYSSEEEEAKSRKEQDAEWEEIEVSCSDSRHFPDPEPVEDEDDKCEACGEEKTGNVSLCDECSGEHDEGDRKFMRTL